MDVSRTPPSLPDLIEPLTCPITCEVPQDPVVAADGFLYERHAIEDWLRNHDTSPMTGQTLVSRVLYSVYPLRSGLSVGSKPAPSQAPLPPTMPASFVHEAKALCPVDAFAGLRDEDRALAETACTSIGTQAQAALMQLVTDHDGGDALLQTHGSLPMTMGPLLAYLAQRAVDARVRQNAVNYLGTVHGLDAVRATIDVAYAAHGVERPQAKAQLFGVVPRLLSIDDETPREEVDALLQSLAQDIRLPLEVNKAAVWALVERGQVSSVRRDVYARLRQVARDARTDSAITAARALLHDAQAYDPDYALDCAVYLAATARLHEVRAFVRSWKESAA